VSRFISIVLLIHGFSYRFDFEIKREQSAGFNLSNLCFEVSDGKSMKVDGKNEDDDDVKVRAKDEETHRVSLLPAIAPILPMAAIFSPQSIPAMFGPNRTHEKSMTVDVYKKK
jgi:hypothetical protein